MTEILTADRLTVVTLLVGALAAARVAVGDRSSWHLAFSALLVWLAADETLDIHESLGEWAERQGMALGPLHDADTLVLAVYGLVVAGMLVAGLRYIRRDRTFLLAVLAATAAGALAVGLDAVGPRQFIFERGEEYLELVAAASLALGFSRAAVSQDSLRDQLPETGFPQHF